VFEKQDGGKLIVEPLLPSPTSYSQSENSLSLSIVCILHVSFSTWYSVHSLISAPIDANAIAELYSHICSL
jgi:hypothetical protein